jgi:hypothetical protein
MTDPSSADRAMHLYDTLTQRVEPLVPVHPGEVRIFVWGPTVYDVPHVGHARSAVAPDVLVRHLRASGLRVTFVRNVTDIDDKILKRASETGEDPLALSARMTAIYREDVGALGCLRPDHEPKVSKHLPEVVGLVQRLLDHEADYVVDMPSGARDVYFSVRSFDGYGKLSRRNLGDLEVGARVEASEHKRDPLDFAPWKGAPGEAYGLPSPWGKGRPGWHIFMGIENVSPARLRYLGRKHGPADARRALALCRDQGLFASFNLMLFDPDCTLEDVVDNLAFAEENLDLPWNICRTELYCGTPLLGRPRRGKAARRLPPLRLPDARHAGRGDVQDPARVPRAARIRRRQRGEPAHHALVRQAAHAPVPPERGGGPCEHAARRARDRRAPGQPGGHARGRGLRRPSASRGRGRGAGLRGADGDAGRGA